MVSWDANEGHYGKVEAGTGWLPSVKIRIFPKDPAVRFDFPVHEMVEPSLKKAGISMKPCDLQVHHYGKLNRKKTKQKGEVYYQIGCQKLDNTNEAPAALRELAIQAEILKKHDEAVELWHRYIAKAPHEPKAYIHLGISYCSLSRFDKVLETAEKTLELLPDSREGHYHFALAKLHLGCPEQALESLNKLCHRAPEYLPAKFLLAATNCAVGNKETAMAMLDKLSRATIGPGLAIRCHELSSGLIASGHKDYALALLEAAIDSKHGNKDVLQLYAECAGLNDTSSKTGTYGR
jgi:tetratricopeptide (TPR) repeat protein